MSCLRRWVCLFGRIDGLFDMPEWVFLSAILVSVLSMPGGILITRQHQRLCDLSSWHSVVAAWVFHLYTLR